MVHFHPACPPTTTDEEEEKEDDGGGCETGDEEHACHCAFVFEKPECVIVWTAMVNVNVFTHCELVS